MSRDNDAEDQCNETAEEGYGSRGVCFHRDLDREGDFFLGRDCTGTSGEADGVASEK